MARYFPSALESITVFFQEVCGITPFVVASDEMPTAFFAVTVNEYTKPFVSPEIIAGLVVTTFSIPD